MIPAAKPRPQGDGPRPARSDQRCRVGLREARGGTCRRSRETGRTARPRGRSACGAAIGRRTLTGQGEAARQCASTAPLHRAGAAGLRQPIVTARPRPGHGARRREARLRAVERGRAASPARGANQSKLFCRANGRPETRWHYPIRRLRTSTLRRPNQYCHQA